MNIHVDNLPKDTTESELRDLFNEYGTVGEVTIITSITTGQSRGFGFVELAGGRAIEAIRALNGYEIDGQHINVKQAEPRLES
jgi:RNA recognition motif-containing protein